MERLNRVLPPTWSHINPVDIIGDADGERYGEALSVLLEDDGVDGILVMNCPSAVTSCTEVAQAVIRTVNTMQGSCRRKTILAGWFGEGCAEKARQMFRQNGIPCYSTPTGGVRGFMQMVRYHQSQEMLMETVPDTFSDFSPDRETALEIIRLSLADKREWLSDCKVRELLVTYGITIAPAKHESSSHELLIGMFEDIHFGPVLLFGRGGIPGELARDRAITLPPLNVALAQEVIGRTEVHKLLEGAEDDPSSVTEEVCLLLVKISQMVCEIGEIKELDINLVLSEDDGITVCGGSVRVGSAGGRAADRLAIRPYPRELEKDVVIRDGRTLLLRPIRPEDESRVQQLFASLSPEEIRMRFQYCMKHLSHDLAARLTQIDYDREMALVLEEKNNRQEGRLLGSVRIIADPDNEEAEFAILLLGEATGIGLGAMLLSRIVEYAGKRGIQKLFGHVLAENTRMLHLADRFGFAIRPFPGEPGMRLVELTVSDYLPGETVKT